MSNLDARLAKMHEEQRHKAFVDGLQAALSIVRTRKAYYELYRCDCIDRDPGNGHRPGCKGEVMSTQPATFAVLDEIATFIEAAIEKAHAIERAKL